jgi:hypothetical protein
MPEPPRPEKNKTQGRRGPGASRQFLALRRKVLQNYGYQCRVEGCKAAPAHSASKVHKIGGGYHAGSIDQYIALCPEHHREVERQVSRGLHRPREQDATALAADGATITIWRRKRTRERERGAPAL